MKALVNKFVEEIEKRCRVDRDRQEASNALHDARIDLEKVRAEKETMSNTLKNEEARRAAAEGVARRLREEIEEMRKGAQRITELYNAARYATSSEGKRRRKAAEKNLLEALDAAERYVDLIPF